MKYNWNQFLSFSEALLQNDFWQDDVSTKYRIIISRAYYAAFHSAQNFLRDYHLESKRAGAEHEKVIIGLKEMHKKNADFQRTCKKVGIHLERLKVRRVQADYRDHIVFYDRDAKLSLRDSKKIIEDINALKENL